MRFDLIRFQSDTYGTFGVLVGKGFACFTVEKPWRDNEPYVSCIPAGEYICKRYHSSKYENTFEITNVPGRSYILFHKGNTPYDVSGCVALGSTHGTIDRKLGVWESSTAFAEFLTRMSDTKEFVLKITEVPDDIKGDRKNENP